MNHFLALSTVFASLADNYAQASAISAPPRSDLTFENLFQLIKATHIQLRQLGINRGDRVVLAAPANSPETATLSLAIAASATCIVLDITLSSVEIVACLEQLNPKVIIAFPDYLLPLSERQSIPQLQVILCPEQPSGTFQLEGITSFSPSQDDWAQPEDDALIVMTSGSTGQPKLVPITQDSLCYSCFETSNFLQLNPQDICLNVLSLFHVHGLISNFLLPLSAGGKVVLPGSFDPNYFLDWLRESQATWYSVSPTIHLAILRAIAKNSLKVKNHALRFIRSGSAPLKPQVIEELEQQLAVPLIQGYGMSEIALFTNTLFPSEQGKHRHQGYLKICRDSELAIADELGNFVPNGTVGEIIARGRNVMAGYINNPAANKAAFREGWFRTGDLGWLDGEGYLYLAGRLKDIINRGGNKVAPQEVDNALMQFPEVEEVGTFAVPHPRLGEDVITAVVLKPAIQITGQDLRALLFNQLAEFKIPSQIVIVDQIPRGRTGKIQRNKLAEKFAQQLQSEYAPPRNELESALAELFTQVLNLNRIGIYDNFFRLGGDSLLGTQLISRICQIFAVNIPIRTLFELPTVAELAQFLTAFLGVTPQQLTNLEYEEGEL